MNKSNRIPRRRIVSAKYSRDVDAMNCLLFCGHTMGIACLPGSELPIVGQEIRCYACADALCTEVSP